MYFNGLIFWGVVGLLEFFGFNVIYWLLVWVFVVGGILFILLWLYVCKRKDFIVCKINFLVLFGLFGWIFLVMGLNFLVWVVVCYVFNYFIKN